MRLFEVPMDAISNLNGMPEVGSVTTSHAGTNGRTDRALGQAVQVAVSGSTANGPENLQTLFSNKRRLAECGARGDPCKNNRPMEQIQWLREGYFPTML